VRDVLPPTLRQQDIRRARIVRVACAAIALGALAGFAFGGALSTSAAADADSSLTIGWTGDTSSAASIQPARDPNGFEYGEFKDIKVKVEQTRNLIDQAVKVDVSGFQGGTVAAKDGTGQIYSTAMNFMQAMECWGDPSSATFRQTCEWGGRFANNNGLGFSVYGDNVYRIAQRDVSPTASNPVDNPFKTRDGQTFTARQALDAKGNKTYPLSEEFGADSSNEVQGARIKDDGTGSFDFEMQSDIEASHLGCGRTAAMYNCYLVLIPRGTVYGGHDPSCSSISGAGGAYTYGQAPAVQAGSPMNPGCDYWNNRIVVPLTFDQVAGVCPSGAERDVIGSQLVIGAMASWQPALCTTAGATFNFNTNPDSVARAQLLETKSDLAFTSYPIVKSALLDSDQPLYDTTAVAYAPVAVGAVTVSFLADGKNGQIDSMVLSPRLLAKLLTQSYIFEVPNYATDPGNDDFAQLGKANQGINYLWQDPDFQALNPNWGDYISNPSIVLPGPSDSDSIEQLWKWIQSDSDARDFLNGKADPMSGMTVNPNYLPAGNAAATVPTFDPITGAANATKLAVGFSNLDGSPQSLATSPIAYFPKADQATVPHKTKIQSTVSGQTVTLPNPDTNGNNFNSIQAAPYVDDYLKAAVVTFRANPGAKTGWDPTAAKSDGTRGDWVSGGPQIPGQRFVISISDAASTARYDLDAVGLRAANGTSVTTPTTTAMSAAISSGLAATSNPAVKQVDPSKVSATGYPLTTVVYAAVNLTQSSAAARASLAKMIKYVSGDGQVPGTQVGTLPAGYLPLPTDLQTQASASATAIAGYVASNSSSDDGINITGPTGTYTVSGSGIGSDGSTAETSASKPTVTALGASKAGLTPASSTGPVLPLILGIALVIGLIGAVFAPLVVRGLGRA
jgi:hypothetical protein